MKKEMILRPLLSGLLSLTILSTAAMAAVSPMENSYYAADYADVLDRETEEYINETNETLFEACGGEIVVVAVDFMDGLSSTDYAMEVAENWGGIGDKDKDNGFLLVYAAGENKVRALAGSGIMDDLPASDIEDMLVEYFYDDYDAGEYDAATRSMFDAVYRWYDSYYHLSGIPAVPLPEPEEQPFYHHLDFYDMIAIMITVAVVVSLLAALLGRRYSTYGGGSCTSSRRRRPGMYHRSTRHRSSSSHRSHSSHHRGGGFRGGGAGRG